MNMGHIIQLLAVAAIPLLFAITIHEVAHGWVACKLGDKTALMMGRLTLNPLKHIDPFGTIILPIVMLIASSSLLGNAFIFGWAKPVPVNFNALRHPRRDMALVAVAGPLTNLLMAIIWAFIAKINIWLPHSASAFVQLSAQFGIMINCVLMVLNLLPIPPLDGSRVISSILPPKISIAYDQLEVFGFWILIFLLLSGLLQPLIAPPIFGLVSLLKSLFGLGS
jgi:Zn-dependent protease